MAKFISGLLKSFEPKVGVIVDLQISVNSVRETFLKDSHLPVPPPITIRGLIDTGATGTCIDTKYIDQLGMTSTNYTRCRTAGGLRYPPTCTVRISVPLDGGHFWSSNYVACAAFNNLSCSDFDALIGLDVLSQFHFVVDGATSQFHLLLPEVPEVAPAGIPMEGGSYFDHSTNCFHRYVHGDWHRYAAQGSSSSLISRLKARFLR